MIYLLQDVSMILLFADIIVADIVWQNIVADYCFRLWLQILFADIVCRSCFAILLQDIGSKLLQIVCTTIVWQILLGSYCCNVALLLLHILFPLCCRYCCGYCWQILLSDIVADSGCRYC